MLTYNEVEVKVLKASDNRILMLGGFENCQSTILLKCKNCEHEWEKKYGNAVKKGIKLECPECQIKPKMKLKQKRKLQFTQNDAEKKVEESTNGILSLVSEYKGIREWCDFKCNICGDVSNREFNSVVYAKRRGCKNCSQQGITPEKKTRIYYMEFIKNGKTYFKLGVTQRDKLERFKEDRISITNYKESVPMTGKEALSLEHRVHRAFKKYKTNDFPIKSGNSEVYETNILKNFSF